MEGFIYSILGYCALGILGFVFGRLTIKTKSEVKVDCVKKEQDEIKDEVKELKSAIPIIMQCLLALLVALKDQKVNGECDKALSQLNDYLIKK